MMQSPVAWATLVGFCQTSRGACKLRMVSAAVVSKLYLLLLRMLHFFFLLEWE